MLKRLGVALFFLCLSQSSFCETFIPADVLDEIKTSTQAKSGEIIYVDFWASWCNPCRKSFPWMNKMAEKYEQQGFKVLAVNVDKNQGDAEKFLDGVQANFPIAYDPQARLAKIFQLKGMPSSFLISADGKVLKAHKGFFENQVDNYELEIQSFLTKSDTGAHHDS